MKITAVVENVAAKENLTAQYGLSLFVETANGSILVDSGQDETALANFAALGLNTDDIKAVFISHNHYDHIGGLGSVARATENPAVPIYLSGGAVGTLYTKKLFRRRRTVSRNDLIEENKDRIVFVDDKVEILPGAYACRVKAYDKEFLCKDRKLRMLGEGGRLVPDDFKHEIYLAVIEDECVKVISPCSHNGIINIIKDAEERFGLPVLHFVGGLHLRGSSSRSLSCSRAHVKRIAKKLGETSLEKLSTCHCTGKTAYTILKKELSDKIKVKYFHTGARFTV